MTRAQIVTRWIQTTDANGIKRNQLALFANDIVPTDVDSWFDATGQPSANIPPSPNLLIVEVNVSDATLAAIKSHAQYGQAAVLWEGDPSQSPVVTDPQYTVLVNFLANRFNATTTQVRNLLGATANGRTRVEIANQIIAYLRERPKG